VETPRVYFRDVSNHRQANWLSAGAAQPNVSNLNLVAPGSSVRTGPLAAFRLVTPPRPTEQKEEGHMKERGGKIG
jgi:hypothetical protein